MILRIISGIYKGRNLNGFDIEGTRPTMDRVKESLFAMIQNNIKGSNCLDLYAGSGALGIEALSNGANHVTLVDENKIAIKIMKENTRGMKEITILHTDAFQLHNHIEQKFNLIFLDPPYHKNLIFPTLEYLKEHDFLEKGAIVICEYEEECFDSKDFEVLKERIYGKKRIKILKF
ncbi:MAG: 16S rRNA (guanine(966)-N(2))-methyltransferase RsmD [Bacilli bacterium]|nr:16S rRNA (guanine(966)-N(2))-methyltransferase RsmD [Bacilli bacterium]